MARPADDTPRLWHAAPATGQRRPVGWQ